MSQIAAALASCLFLSIMALASVADIWTYRIPNILSVILAAAGATMVPLAGIPLSELGYSVLAAVVVLTIGFGLFAFRLVGGGDVKIASAAVLWFPAMLIPKFLFVSILVGGVIALALLAFRQAARSALLPSFIFRSAWVVRLADDRRGVPYGAAFGVAAYLVFPQTHWFSIALG